MSLRRVVISGWHRLLTSKTRASGSVVVRRQSFALAVISCVPKVESRQINLADGGWESHFRLVLESVNSGHELPLADLGL